MSIGWLQIAIVAVIVILLFGRGKIASLMSEVALGIKSFRKGLDDGKAAPLDADEITSDKDRANKDRD